MASKPPQGIDRRRKWTERPRQIPTELEHARELARRITHCETEKALDKYAKKRSIRALAAAEATSRRAMEPLPDGSENSLVATSELLGWESEDEETGARDVAVYRARAFSVSRVRRSREDPCAFARYAFRDDISGNPLDLADIHVEMHRGMTDPDHTDFLCMLPRDHGKTTQLEINAIWQLGNDPNKRLKIISANDSKAVERLYAIQQHIENNPCVKDVFPWLRPYYRGSWTKHKLIVARDRIGMRDASIEAVGVTSTATGGRSDINYYDDVVDRRNALEFPTLRETVKRAIDSDWSNILEPTGRANWICTPWHEDDCTAHLLARGHFRVMRAAIGPNLEPVWPEKWPRERLAKRREQIGSREFDRAFRLIPLAGAWSTVPPDTISYWSGPPSLGDVAVFQGYDLATSLERGDYFACVTVGMAGAGGADPVIYVLDAWHARISFLAQYESVKTQGGLWRPEAQAIEATQYQAVLPQILQATTMLNITPVRPRISKELRLAGISPLIERKRILFNPALHPDRIRDKERGDLIGELTAFPLGRNDDMVDAFVHACGMAIDWSLRSEHEAVRVSSICSVRQGGDVAGELVAAAAGEREDALAQWAQRER